MPLVLQKARTSPLASPELTASEKRMMGYLIRAWDQQKQHLLEQEGALIDALTHGPEPRVLALIDDMPLLRAQEQIDLELRFEAIASAERTRIPGVRLRKLKEPLVLDLTEPRRQSADWARKRAGTLITEITTDQRTAVRNIIADAEQVGISPRDTARRLRDVVGITSTQAGWVSNYRDRILTDGLARGLPAARAEQRARTMGDKYARRVHTYRAETIARTEIAFASHQGRREVWAAAFGEGYIDATWRKKWVTNEDGRECEECAALNETTVLLTEDFIEGDPPLHPNCRCDVQLLEPEPGASMVGPGGQGVADPDAATAAAQTAPGDTLPQWAKDAGMQDALDQLPDNFEEIGMVSVPETDADWQSRYMEAEYRDAMQTYGLTLAGDPDSWTAAEISSKIDDAQYFYDYAQQDYDIAVDALAVTSPSDPDYLTYQLARDMAQARMLEESRWMSLGTEVTAQLQNPQRAVDWRLANPRGSALQIDMDAQNVPGPTLRRHVAAVTRVGEIIDAEARTRINPTYTGTGSFIGDASLLLRGLPAARLAVLAELRAGNEHIDMISPLTADDKAANSKAKVVGMGDAIFGLRSDALSLFPRDWLGETQAAGYTLGWGTTERGFASADRGSTRRAVIALSGDTTGELRATARHEIGHWVSEHSGAVQRMEYALLHAGTEKDSKGQTKKAILYIKPSGKVTTEKYWPFDKNVFGHWYSTRSYIPMDRIQEGLRTGDWRGWGAMPSEVLSSGTQAALPQTLSDIPYLQGTYKDGLEYAISQGPAAAVEYVRRTSHGRHVEWTLGVMATLGRRRP